jgi:hypothetical protein
MCALCIYSNIAVTGKRNIVLNIFEITKHCKNSNLSLEY